MKISTRLYAVATGCMLTAGMLSQVQAATPDDALVMAWNIDAISTFDPAQIGEVVTTELITNTCDPLVSFDPRDQTKVIPAIAKSWEVSPDQKSITFHLVDNAKFPSGNPMTAQDVVWSLKRVIKLGFGNGATLTEFGLNKNTMDTAITAPDDHTLVLKFDKTYPSNLLLQSIAASDVSTVLDQKTVMEHDKNGDLGNAYLKDHTECVGPYRLVQWHQGEGVMLQANDNYYGEKPKIGRILIRHVTESGTQRLLLQHGDVDIARDLTPEDLAAVEKDGNVNVQRVLKPQLIFLTMNVQKKPFDNPKVRLAMKYLFDYDSLGNTVMKYLGEPWQSFAQSGAWGALKGKDGTPYGLNIDKARQLLAEAGYPKGFNASLDIGSLPWSSPLAQHLQENASKVGVHFNIEQMANAQLFSKARGRDFQTIIMAWQTGVPDAYGNASRLVYNPDNSLDARATQYPSWRAGYQDKGYNERFLAASVETDDTKRAEMYERLQKDWMKTGEMAVLFQTYNIAAMNNNLKNWTWNGLQTFYARVEK